MIRVLVACALLSIGAACSSKETDGASLPVLATDAVCPVACSGFEVVGPLVELAPASRSAAVFTQLAKTDAGWAVAWHSELEKSAYLQRIDASGAPAGGAFRVQDAQGLAPHWDGTSLSLWTLRYDEDTVRAGQPQRLSYARFDSALLPLESASLLGPAEAASFIAYDLAGAQVFAYAAARVAASIRQLRMLPGTVLEQSEHFLTQAEEGTSRVSLAWTGKEIAATYFTAQGYRTTFLDPTTLVETKTVDLGGATSQPPQDIQSVMGERLLWIAVWETSEARLWLHAIDVAAGATAMDPIQLPWIGTLNALTTVGDAPLVISRPMTHSLGEPENDVIVPVDPETKSACQGTRFGRANVIDLELDGSEGAALLDAYNQHLYFARLRCK